MPHHFVSPSGHPVVVGRNAKENHHLSTLVLKGSDIWFHTADYPGAHVILQLKRGEIASRKDIEFCIELAQRFSSNPNAKGVTIAQGTDIVYEQGDPIGTMTVLYELDVSV